MTISVVQTNSGTANNFTSGSHLTIFTGSVTAGNSVFLAIGDISGFTVSSVTLTSTSQALTSEVSNTAAVPLYIFALPSANASPGTQVTVNVSNTSDLPWVSYEVSGMNASSFLDKTNNNDVTPSGFSTFTSNATATTAIGNEFWLGAVMTTSGATRTVTGAWSNSPVVDSVLTSGYQITTSTGAATYSGSFGTSSNYAALVATFRGAPTNPLHSRVASQAVKRASVY